MHPVGWRRFPAAQDIGPIPRHDPAGPIAFVHIPKTGGRSVIHAFEHALGADHCASFVPRITEHSFDDARFVAGHVQLADLPAGAFALTFLRDPVRQLAGHIAWLDRYNHPIFWEELLPFPPALKDLIRRVGRIDFASPRSLADFLAWLPHDSPARLRNVQCEVLAARPDRLAYHTEAEMAAAAIRNLDRLDFVGITERLPTDLPRLFRRLRLGQRPLVTNQNWLSSPRRLDLTDPAVVAVLRGAVGADLALYHHATRRTWQGRIGRVHTLARRCAARGKRMVRALR